MPPSRSVLATLVALALAGCGARSTLVERAVDAGVGGSSGAGGSDAATPVRDCPPECFAGHECCAGSCEGPAVPIPGDCCSCLPGEISSALCVNATCGG